MSVHLPLFSSLAHSISVSLLVMQPFSGPQQVGVIKQVTPTQLRQLGYGRAGWPTEICTKKRLPSRPSFIQCSHEVESTTRKGNWTGLSRRKKLGPVAWPRCLVDRAPHWQLSTPPCGTQPCNGAFISCYNTPRTFNPQAAHHHYTAALLSH